MTATWIGLALLFLVLAVFFWSRTHPPDQSELAARLYAEDVAADQPPEPKA